MNPHGNARLRLTDATGGKLMWQSAFERATGDVSRIGSDMATDVASALAAANPSKREQKLFRSMPMNHCKIPLAALSALFVLCTAVHAQNPPRRGPDQRRGPPRQQLLPPPPQATPNVDLQAFLQRVAASSHKQFLIDNRVRQRIYVGGTPIAKPTYAILLAVLSDNGLAAVPSGDRVNIVPARDVRQYAMPLVERDDASIPDDAWVTRVISVKGVNAGGLVPILRPLLPREAHLAALPGNATDNKINKLLIVDRYANVRRITAIVDALTR